MSIATLTNTCGAEESLDALLLRIIDDDQVRRLIADVLTTSLPLGGLLVRYLRLHKPLKQKLDEDTKRAAPMPDAVRERLAALRGRKDLPNDLPTHLPTEKED